MVTILKNPYFYNTLVSEYYDNTFALYYSIYSKKHVHFGLWDKNTRDYDQSLDNTTRLVVKHLNINNDDIVLDAGCGIGGSSRYIVSKYGVQTIGVTLSDKQLSKAKILSKKIKNNHLLQFLKIDFTKTNFPNESFTKIFSIEAACYAPRLFVKESYRLLKKGGKLVICDGIQLKKTLNKNEKKLFLGSLIGYALPQTEEMQDFIIYIYSIGYSKVTFEEKSKEISKSCWLIHRKAKMVIPISFLLHKLKIIPKLWHQFVIANYNQKILMDTKVTTYGVFVIDK